MHLVRLPTQPSTCARHTEHAPSPCSMSTASIAQMRMPVRVIACALLLDTACGHAPQLLAARVVRPAFHARTPVRMVSEIPLVSEDAAKLESSLDLELADAPDGVICARGEHPCARSGLRVGCVPSRGKVGLCVFTRQLA